MCPTNLLKDAMSATVNGTKLCGHDGLDRRFTLHFTRKPRNFRNDHNDLCNNPHALDVLQIGPKILTLNFVPDLAARIILSTRAAAIWFLTGPSFPVFDMLQVQISIKNYSRIGGRLPSSQELVLYNTYLESHVLGPRRGTTYQCK